jgi:DNA-binding CsgD family transcriptional regulator
MGYDSRFADTIGSIYDAAADPDLWVHAIRNIAGHVGADGGVFVGFSWSGAQVAVHRGTPSDPESEDLYRSRWARNPWADRAIRRPTGDVFTSGDLIDQSALERTDYYCDYLQPRGIVHGLFGVLAGNADFMAGMTIHRNHRLGAFQKAEVESWRAFVPHLQRAAQIQLRLAGQASIACAALATLDQAVMGIVLLDMQGNVRFANEKARHIIARNDALCIVSEQIVSITPPAQRRLRSLVADALRLSAGEVCAGGGATAIARSGDKVALQLLVTPIIGAAAQAWGGRGAVIYIRDPDDVSTPDAKTLAELFGLTPTEAKVALLIASGVGVAEAATALGIGKPTLKTHLARAFHKTRTSRQAELAALVTALPQTFSPPRIT